MRPVRFFGPIGEASGYGQAVANFAEAFHKSGIPTQYHFASNKMKLIRHLNNYSGQTEIDFYLHCPPYNRHKSRNYKIAYFYWEADRLPSAWARSLKEVNEIWAPCELVKNACRLAGFTGKINVVPTPVKEFELNHKISIPSNFSKKLILSDDVFKFYSIFQWHERKGYKELLRAYFSEFSASDNVVLILKVNPLNVGINTMSKINQDIDKIKKYLGNKEFPLLYVSKKILPVEDIYALHNISHCYVSPHHGEGWGMPIHDAMFAGKQIITTQFGGVTEYLDKDSAHLIDYELKPVSGMEWSNLYNSYQNWAYPNVKHLSILMREVYQNYAQYNILGENAKKVAKVMNIDGIAELIKEKID